MSSAHDSHRPDLSVDDSDSLSDRAIREAYAAKRIEVSEVERTPVFSPTFVIWVIAILAGIIAPVFVAAFALELLQAGFESLSNGQDASGSLWALFGIFWAWSLVFAVMVIYLAKARNLMGALAFTVFFTGPVFVAMVLPRLLP